MIITIDGPSGTGKTTVAKRVAEKLHFSYFDTGAMYRAVTWLALQKKIDLDDETAVFELLQNFHFRIEEKEGAKRYFVGENDVTQAIRTPEINTNVSKVAALLPVRKSLWKIQHEFAKNGDAVFEGRDIGSVVFPEAEVKVFLTARPEVRAQRRLKEYLEKHPQLASSMSEEQMLKDIMRRDELDSTREHAPLTCPKDAVQIDTSELTLDQVVEKILEHKGQEVKWPKGNLLYRTILFLADCFFSLFYRHKVYGKEHFIPGGAIIAANHASYFDPPIAAISSPQEVHFLAKDYLFKVPLFGSFIRALNSHPVRGDAGDVAVFKLLTTLLKEGKKVILFPEGKREDEDRLEEIKPGMALLITRTGAFVQPLYIHGTFKVWSRYRKLPKLSGTTASVWGSPIRYDAFKHLEKREAQEAFSLEVGRAINALRAWYEAGAKGTPP
jgi:cytidylate kinase